jgi:hypothetical protein
MIWTTAYILAKARKLTGRLTAGQINDVDLLAIVNEYYLTVFSMEAVLPSEERFWTFVTTAVETGAHSWDSGITAIKTPVFAESAALSINEYQLNLFYSKEIFYNIWPNDVTTGYTRAQPQDMLVMPGSIQIMPPPDGVYTINATAEYGVVTALDLSSSNPSDETFGPVIAYGAAITLHNAKGEPEAAAALAGMYQYYLKIMNRKGLQFLAPTRTIPTW